MRLGQHADMRTCGYCGYRGFPEGDIFGCNISRMCFCSQFELLPFCFDLGNMIKSILNRSVKSNFMRYKLYRKATVVTVTLCQISLNSSSIRHTKTVSTTGQIETKIWRQELANDKCACCMGTVLSVCP